LANIGPVEYMVVGFPGNNFRGEIIPALKELVEQGTIRVIDLAFVLKNAKGDIVSMELEDIDSDTGRAFKEIESRVGDLVNEADLHAVGQNLEPNSSAAVLVWEDLWAARIATAIKDADGVLLGLERVPRDVVEAALEYAQAK
jgi:hypothetical protein